LVADSVDKQLFYSDEEEVKKSKQPMDDKLLLVLYHALSMCVAVRDTRIQAKLAINMYAQNVQVAALK
jgi:hypothetical protein